MIIIHPTALRMWIPPLYILESTIQYNNTFPLILALQMLIHGMFKITMGWLWSMMMHKVEMIFATLPCIKVAG